MDFRNERVLSELAAVRRGPCVSIYMPTSHGKNGCDENILRFKNLKKIALNSLSKGYDSDEISDFEQRMNRLESDSLFWNRQLNGIAVFLSEGYQRIVNLHRGVTPLAIVADRFHVKPLLRQFQSLDQFLVLALTSNHSRIYRGDRDGMELDAVQYLNFTAEDFFGVPDRDRHLVAMAVAGNGGNPAKSRTVFHNYDDVDAKRRVAFSHYCAAIDEVICKHLLDHQDMPVVLASLAEHQNIYRSQSRIPRLLDKGIIGNPEAMTIDALREEAWSIIAPLYESKATELADQYRYCEVAGKGSDNLHEIARALAHGRVGKLILEQDRNIPGRVMLDSGVILFSDIQNPHVNDLLDDFADIVSQKSGEVVVLPPAKMPTTRGVAAIYRY